VPGAFEASDEFEYDALATAEEINRSGEHLLWWIEGVVESDHPWPVDTTLINEIHRRWFDSTFPADAGRYRNEVVLNRKQTAAPVEGILPALTNACDNWNWRRDNLSPNDEAEAIEFIIVEANTLAVAAYDVHPYIDGNTRTTWHLRNYVLMLDGLRPLIEFADESAYEDAWWAATPHDHEALDRIVLEQLNREDR